MIISSCEEPEKESINILPTEIYTEYNPTPLSMSCDSTQIVRVLIPKPYIFLAPPGEVDTTFQILKVSIAGLYNDEFKISNDFSELKDGKRKRKSTKYFEFEMPSYESLGISEGTIELELYSKDKLVDDYSARFKFLEDDEELNVINKTGILYVKGDREISSDPTYDFRIKEAGTYANDITFTHNVQKKDGHYLVTAKALGGDLYKLDKSKKKTWVTKIPPSKVYETRVPLNMELEEGLSERKSVGNVVLKEKNIGYVPGYVYYLDASGKSETVSFSNCQKNIVNEEIIYIPSLTNWATVQEVTYD